MIPPDGQTLVRGVSAAESEQLGSIARSRSLPHSLVPRARIMLMSAEGVSNQSIAARWGSAFRPSASGGAAGANAGWLAARGTASGDGRAAMATNRWRR